MRIPAVLRSRKAIVAAAVTVGVLGAGSVAMAATSASGGVPQPLPTAPPVSTTVSPLPTSPASLPVSSPLPTPPQTTATTNPEPPQSTVTSKPQPPQSTVTTKPLPPEETTHNPVPETTAPPTWTTSPAPTR